MENATIIGYVMLAMISIGSFVILVIKFTKPINDLRVVIERLNTLITELKSANEKNRHDIEEIHSRINKINTKVDELAIKVSLYHNG